LFIYLSSVVYNAFSAFSEMDSEDTPTLQVSHYQCETCASGRGASGAVQRQLQPVAPCAACSIKAQHRAPDKVVCLFVLQSGLAAGLEDPSRSGAWEEGGEVRYTKRD
jgi:hypothetical protein